MHATYWHNRDHSFWMKQGGKHSVDTMTRECKKRIVDVPDFDHVNECGMICRLKKSRKIPHIQQTSLRR